MKQNLTKVMKFIKRLFSVLLILSMGLAIGFTIYYYPKIRALYMDANTKVSEIKTDTFKSSQTTLIYDNKNQLLTKLKGSKDAYYLDYGKIPDNFKYAFIAIEDKNFLNHNGVDLKANARAVYALLKNRGKITQGASTITQQLSRNTFLTFQQSYERKIEEIFISFLLEKKYDKKQILEFYLNSIYFSNGEYGIESASKKYFGKSASELNLAQVAFISSIPNNPTLFDPIKHFDNTQKRKEKILENMKSEGYIKDKDYQDAIKFNIKLVTAEKLEKHNYVETYVQESATTTLMQMKGFQFKYEFNNDSEKQAYNKEYEDIYSSCQKELYTGGYRIYTSMDMDKENLLQQAVDSTLGDFTEKSKDGVYAFQGAATSIDNSTGKVVAIVGGRSQDFSGYTLNRAFQSYRQPGSTFKPIAVYTPAFENGYTPNSLVDDHKFDGGPKNDDSQYQGNIPIRYAVAMSKNTVAWQVFNDIGPKKGLSYITKMHFNKIVDADYNLSSALGGLTYGASTLEMASAYSALSRDGYFYEPTCINKITDASDKVLYNDSREPISVYSQKSARMMTDVLKTVMTEGTGRRVSLDIPSAGKTGTTSGSKDGWLAGYTPYYTTVVWCGYDIPRTLDSLYGSSYPGRIWNQYMTAIHQGLPVKDFETYQGMDDDQIASDDKVKQEEARKVLVDEIESRLDIYQNKEINSLSDVESLQGVYSELSSKINQLNDDSEKKDYMKRINDRKAVIEERKKELQNKEIADKNNATKNQTDNTGTGTNTNNTGTGATSNSNTDTKTNNTGTGSTTNTGTSTNPNTSTNPGEGPGGATTSTGNTVPTTTPKQSGSQTNTDSINQIKSN